MCSGTLIYAAESRPALLLTNWQVYTLRLFSIEYTPSLTANTVSGSFLIAATLSIRYCTDVTATLRILNTNTQYKSLSEFVTNHQVQPSSGNLLHKHSLYWGSKSTVCTRHRTGSPYTSLSTLETATSRVDLF